MPNLIPPPPNGTITDLFPQPVWLNWFNAVQRFLNMAPTISSGILSPTTTPNKVGDMFVDTVAKKIYIAVGNSSNADWEIVN